MPRLWRNARRPDAETDERPYPVVDRLRLGVRCLRLSRRAAGVVRMMARDPILWLAVVSYGAGLAFVALYAWATL